MHSSSSLIHSELQKSKEPSPPNDLNRDNLDAWETLSSPNEIKQNHLDTADLSEWEQLTSASETSESDNSNKDELNEWENIASAHDISEQMQIDALKVSTIPFNSPKTASPESKSLNPLETNNSSTRKPPTIGHIFSDAEKKAAEHLVQRLKHTLQEQVAIFDAISAFDSESLMAYLKETLGLHTARSFELISRLTRDLSYINKELLRPDPLPLPADQKDEKAYQALREKLSAHKPLQELIDHIWKRSRFLKVGENVGPNAKKPNDTIQLSAMTLNGAWLPEYFFGLLQFNSFLRHNPERLQEAIDLFHEIIQNITQLDFIFLEEAWKNLLSEGSTRQFLKEQFTRMGYHVFADQHDQFLSLGSGLLGFSKHPIVDESFRGFVKRRTGTETIAHKGAAVAMVLIDNKYTVTLATMHATSGDGIIQNDVNILGTTSELRGEEQQLMHTLVEEYNKEVVIVNPKTGKPYPHLGTIYGEDTNKTNNQLYQLLALSTGKSLNQRLEGNIKYQGDFNNFKGILTRLTKECWPIPLNSIDVLQPKTTQSGSKKSIDSSLEEKAKTENLATGSTYSAEDLRENKAGHKELTLQTTEHHVIDMIAVKPNDKAPLKAFESYLLNATNTSGKAITDHAGLIAFMLFATPKENAEIGIKDVGAFESTILTAPTLNNTASF